MTGYRTHGGNLEPSARAAAVAAARCIELVVVSETRLYREGLAREVGADERLEVVAVAAGLGAALDVLARLERPPDVVLLDHSIAEGAGAVRELRRREPELRVLVVAAREAEADVIPWAEAGAAGFLPHDASLDDLLEGVAAVASGCGHCSPRIAAALLNRVAYLAGERRPAPDLSELTQRERDVAMLLADGRSNKEIALVLKIQIATVKNHVHSILEKLEVRRRGEAASILRSSGRV